MKTGILLSACLITRNEERNLERCLKSIKKLVDEIVVVDTGSEDGTLSIAKHFGARIYRHPWQNDFSLHRNQAISYAKGRWIMIIDADEELHLEGNSTNGQIRDMLSRIESKYPSAALTLKDMQKGMNTLQFSTTRFFRKFAIHYEGRVHNQPILNPPGQAVYCPFASIYHYGYDLTPEQKAAKFERTSSLLLKQVELGEMKNMFPYFYLCQLYADYRNNEEATKWGELYWENRDKIEEGTFCEAIFFTMTKQYMKAGNREKAYEWLERGVAKLPGDLDMSLAAVEYGVWVGDMTLQIDAAKDYIKAYEGLSVNPLLKKNRFQYGFRPEAMAYVLFHKVVAEILSGTESLVNFFEVLKKVPEPMRIGMMGELEEALSKSVLPIHFKNGNQEVIQQPQSEHKMNFVTANLQ